MMDFLRTNALSVLIGLLLLAILSSWPAEATRFATGTPTVVVTVDLQKVMDSLAERADLEAALNVQSQEILAERDRRQAEIEQLVKDLEDIVEGPDRDRLQEEVDLKVLQEMAWLRFIQLEIDVEKALMLENLYRNMKLNAAELAKINKIELIIVDDSSGDFEVVAGVQISRQEQIAEQISRRKILYRAQAIDITDDLIVRMNNEYAASTGSR